MLNVRAFGAAGDGTQDDAPAFDAAIAAMGPQGDATGSTLLVPKGVYRLSRTLHITRQLVLQGVSGAGWHSGSTLRFDEGVTGIVVHKSTTSPRGGQGDWSVIRDIAVRCRGMTTPGAHGIQLLARAKIENFLVAGFSGDGLHIAAGSASTPSANANSWYAAYGRIEACGGNGLFVDQSDANAGIALALDCSHNAGWGIYDSSFLGNTYVACHTEENGKVNGQLRAMGEGGPYRTDSPVGASVFLGCYSESGQNPSILVHPTLVLGGLHAAGLGGGAQLIGQGALTGGFGGEGGVSFMPMAGGAANSIFGFKGAGSAEPTYFKRDADGWYTFKVHNLDAMQPLRFSDREAAEGGGLVHFPGGYLIGGGAERRRHVMAAAPPASGDWVQGDLAYNTHPAAGGWVGWVCVAGGRPGTWKPFGSVAP